MPGRSSTNLVRVRVRVRARVGVRVRVRVRARRRVRPQRHAPLPGELEDFAGVQARSDGSPCAHLHAGIRVWLGLWRLCARTRRATSRLAAGASQQPWREAEAGGGGGQQGQRTQAESEAHGLAPPSRESPRPACRFDPCFGGGAARAGASLRSRGGKQVKTRNAVRSHEERPSLLGPPPAYEHAVRVLVHVRNHLECAAIVAVMLLDHRHARVAVQEGELLRERAAAVQRQA
eukprot:scaffold9393_cov66-Phaeocystis_antarctica.AAC.6